MLLLLAQTSQPSAEPTAWHVFFIWGALGGLLVDGLEIVRVLKQDPAALRTFLSPGFLTAEVLRLAIGGILAYALGATGEIRAPLGALVVGITAPVIIERYLANPPAVSAGTAGAGA